MYIEIYVDSLLLVNFVMNLYLLILVNHSTYNTAGSRRLLFGAAVGAFVWLLPLLNWGPAALRVILSALVGTWLMIRIVFGVRDLRAGLRILKKLLWFSFVLGGGVLFLQGVIPAFKENAVGIFGVMGAGGLVFLLAWDMKNRRRKPLHCPVTLVIEKEGEQKSVETYGLIDSGNSLIEPISGKPVSVIDQSVYEKLWEEEPLLWRPVPYHSIGKKRGILKAYTVSEVWLEPEGMPMRCREVYVAVSPEPIDGMIVHPALLEGKRPNQKKPKSAKQKSNKEKSNKEKSNKEKSIKTKE